MKVLNNKLATKTLSAITYILILTPLLLGSVNLLAMFKPAANIYAAIDLVTSASDREIDVAIKKLLRKWHPDSSNRLTIDEQSIQAKKWKEVGEARRILTDDALKLAYDLDNGFATPESQSSEKLLKFASVCNAIGIANVREALSYGAKLNSVAIKLGNKTALMLAIDANCIDMVKLLISNIPPFGHDAATNATAYEILNASDLNGQTVLIHAILLNLSGTLTEVDADAHRDAKHETAEHAEAEQHRLQENKDREAAESLEIFNNLVAFLKRATVAQRAAWVNFTPPNNHEQQTPIMYTIISPSLNATQYLKLLIDYGADINAQDTNGHTPLMLAVLAAFKGQSNIENKIDLLLRKNANVSIKDATGKTALDIANESLELVKSALSRSEAPTADIPALEKIIGILSGGSAGGGSVGNFDDVRIELHSLYGNFNGMLNEVRSKITALSDKLTADTISSADFISLLEINLISLRDQSASFLLARLIEKTQQFFTKIRAEYTWTPVDIDYFTRIETSLNGVTQNIKDLYKQIQDTALEKITITIGMKDLDTFILDIEKYIGTYEAKPTTADIHKLNNLLASIGQVQAAVRQQITTDLDNAKRSVDQISEATKAYWSTGLSSPSAIDPNNLAAIASQLNSMITQVQTRFITKINDRLALLSARIEGLKASAGSGEIPAWTALRKLLQDAKELRAQLHSGVMSRDKSRAEFLLSQLEAIVAKSLTLGFTKDDVISQNVISEIADLSEQANQQFAKIFGASTGGSGAGGGGSGGGFAESKGSPPAADASSGAGGGSGGGTSAKPPFVPGPAKWPLGMNTSEVAGKGPGYIKLVAAYKDSGDKNILADIINQVRAETSASPVKLSALAFIYLKSNRGFNWPEITPKDYVALISHLEALWQS